MTIVAALIATLVLLLVGMVAGVVVWRRRKKQGKDVTTNYRSLFIIGIVCAVVGAGLMIASFFSEMTYTIGLPFLIVGIVYLSQSLANRDKWKRTSPPGQHSRRPHPADGQSAIAGYRFSQS